MDPQPAQLEALLAITDLGSFDAAAHALHVTPSAISQRIGALETAVGRVLVSRGSPCRPTEAGEALVTLGRQTRLLYDEARSTLDRGTVDLSVAVNADSLATWWRPVLSEVATWEDVALRLEVEDQAHSRELLRRGEVLAAVTSDPRPVQGCSVEPLGVLRYVPVATPSVAARRRGRSFDWAGAPLVVFNEKDELQDAQLARRGVGRPPVVHRVPSSADFRAAVLAGLGWGMLPEPHAREPLADGRLVRLSRDRDDVPHYWQRWRLQSITLARLTDVVRGAARAHLRRPGSS